ncbi:PilN domain-containing protein [Desulfuribacillus alkaliarsenatis]|uniref:Fimbrial assembly protein n=1 Tax=Desulfuribacillus alkaliarsenatis TaxID=766136 RepID=A0A1E5G580_9FIRM|nr:hypothetical protein [Desulfuribacillus alkaliarsenatis]OEF98326.1 hypothetical protein BHF68_01200 [Desulfuribacillus alkaliarsenatis]
MISKKMNLLPIEYQQRYEVDTKAFLQKAIISLFVISFIAFLFLGKYQLYALEREITSLESQQRLLSEQSASLLSIQEELVKLEGQWTKYDTLGVQSIPLNEFLKDVTESTPKDIWYTTIELYQVMNDSDSQDTEQTNVNLQHERLHFNMKGYSQSVASVGQLAYILNQLSYTDKVVIDYSAEITLDTVSLIEFSIQGRITQ